MVMSYNGWSNYETWCVQLWCTNEEPIQRHWKQTVRQACDDACGIDPEDDQRIAASTVERYLDDFLTDDIPDLSRTMYGDLLMHAIGMCDLYEIARAWVRDEYKERARNQ